MAYISKINNFTNNTNYDISAVAVKVTDTVPTTNTTYYPNFTTGVAANTNYTLRGTKHYYLYDAGTAATGVYLNIGAANYKGGLTLHTNSSYYGDIAPTILTANRTYTLPDASGTVALTSNLSAYVLKAGDTMTGTLKLVSGSGVYTEGSPMLYFLSGSASSYQKQGAIFTDSTTVNSKRVCSRFYFREYSYNSSTGAVVEQWDQYRLPAVAADKTSSNSYEILTSKSAVTIAQGGTSATTAGAAANNLLLGLPTWTANPNDDTYFIRRDTAGGDAFGQVKASTIYNYIAGKTTVSNTWTGGTTAGPTIKTTVNGVTGTAVAIPSASKTSSGVVTTGNQDFKGIKGFDYMIRYGRNGSGSAVRWVADTYLYNDAGTQVGEFWYDCGDAINITTGQYVWSQYSPNSTANTSTTGKKENYKLPVVTSGLTENKNYNIITTKNPGDLYWANVQVSTSSSTTTSPSFSKLTLTNTDAVEHIKFSRTGYNYVIYPTGGTIAFGTACAAADSQLRIDENDVSIPVTLVLSKTQDAAGTSNNSPALIVGGNKNEAHLEFDNNEILAKSNGTTPSTLYLQDGSGTVTVSGTGGLGITATTETTSRTTGAVRISGGLGVAKNIWANSLFWNGGSVQRVEIIHADDNSSQAAGWYRTCVVSANTSYANFFVEFTGGWNNGAPTNALIHVAMRNAQADISILHRGFTGRIDQVRLVKNATNSCYLDLHLVATSGSTAALQACFIGNVTITNIASTNTITTSTDNILATADMNTYSFYNSGTGKFNKVYGAVWNDYAEYRKDNPNEIQEPGRCIKELGDGSLALTTQRLERGCEIVSDTFGFAIGQDQENGYNTPIASNGRVLAYPYESIEEFTSHIGWPVCSGPNGTVSIMTEEEEEKYPSRIIGTISEIPTYEEWGTGNVKVNGRVWIRIK